MELIGFKVKNQHPGAKPVCMIDYNTKEILAEFSSVRGCSLALGLNRTTVAQQCDLKYYSRKKDYYFRFKKDL